MSRGLGDVYKRQLLIVVALLFAKLEAEKRDEEYFKQAENNPSMSTRHWDQHQRRLNKFSTSNYRRTTFYVGPKGGVYYLTARGTKVYC